MAKGSSKGSSKSEAAPAPTTAGSATIAAAPATASSSEPPRPTLVVDWEAQQGDAPTFENEGGMDGAVRVGEAEVSQPGDIDLSGEDQPVVTRRETERERETEKPAAEREAEATRSEKRRQVFAALERSKTRLAAEQAAKTAQDAATAAQRRAEEAEAKLTKATTGTLADKLAFLGLSQEELTDAIIMNGGGLVAAAKKDGASTGELAELKREIAEAKKLAADATEALKKEQQTKEQAEVQRAVQTSRDNTRKIITEQKVEAPLTLSLKAEDRVLRGAWEAWKETGEKGSIADYIPAAAEVIEEQLAKEYPDLAKLAKGRPAQVEEEEPAPVVRRSMGRPSVGRRPPAPRSPQRDSLYGVLDGDERNRIIAREMGWAK